MKIAIEFGITDQAWTPAMLDPEAVAAFGRATEDAGFDALGVTDHPAPSRRWVDTGGEGSADPISTMGFLAAHTTRIRLFPWVLVPPFHGALIAAHQVATLDRLSRGRITLALGTGYLRSEYRAVGADFDRRRATFDESVAAMLAAWSTDDLTISGAGFSARGTHPRPPVVQQPHPPIWIHGNGTWARERIARYGQGWIVLLTGEPLSTTIRTVPVPDLDAMRRGRDELDDLLRKEGRDPAEVDTVVSGLWPRLDVRRGWDADAILTTFGELSAAGVDHVVMSVIGDDPAAALDTVAAFGAEVVRPATAL